MPFGALVYGIVFYRASVHWTVLTVTLLMMVICIAFLAAFLKD
ncbi:MAG: hypothetical protein HPY66_0554 [Firmicutes bacterium]|nr:hypothetical protein [Bacillota bacterium]